MYIYLNIRLDKGSAEVLLFACKLLAKKKKPKPLNSMITDEGGLQTGPLLRTVILFEISDQRPCDQRLLCSGSCFAGNWDEMKCHLAKLVYITITIGRNTQTYISIYCQPMK